MMRILIAFLALTISVATCQTIYSQAQFPFYNDDTPFLSATSSVGGGILFATEENVYSFTSLGPLSLQGTYPVPPTLTPQVIQLTFTYPTSAVAALVPRSDLGSIYAVSFASTGAQIQSSAVLPFSEPWSFLTGTESDGYTKLYLVSLSGLIAISAGSGGAQLSVLDQTNITVGTRYPPTVVTGATLCDACKMLFVARGTSLSQPGQIVSIGLNSNGGFSGQQTVMFVETRPNQFFGIGAFGTPLVYWTQAQSDGILFQYNMQSQQYNQLVVPFHSAGEQFGGAYTLDSYMQNLMLYSGTNQTNAGYYVHAISINQLTGLAYTGFYYESRFSVLPAVGMGSVESGGATGIVWDRRCKQ